MCLGLLKTSIGKKFLMGCTGLMLMGFVLAHLLGNLQIFAGQEAINAYAHKMQALPAALLWTVRLGLLTVFLVHVWLGLWLALENKKARPVGYAKKDTVKASWASRSMVPTGLVLLAFVVYHLLHYTLGKVHPEYFHFTDAKGRHDVYSMMVLSFRRLDISAAYGAAMLSLYLHLSHGAGSFFQSLGLNSDKWRRCFERFGRVFALLIFAGYISIPAAVLCGWISLPPGVRP